MRKRIGVAVFTWIVLVGLGELVFIGWFRWDGSGRADYGEAFPREHYIRTHLDRPCVFNGGLPCTQEQLAEYHHETTVDFWLDVRDNSLPVLLRLFALLIVCLLGLIAWEQWQRGRGTLRQRRW